MAKSALLALAVAFALVAVARSIPFEENDLSSEESLWSLYERWRSHHTVSRDLDEKKERFTVFKENVKFIHEFNQKKDATYKLGLNKFADLTNEEFQNTYTRLKKRGSPKSDGTFMYEHASSPPASVDWRTEGAVTPIKDQENCEAGWAFSAIASVECINQITTGELITLSAQQLVDCVGDNNGCGGGQLDKAFEFIMQNDGVATEDAYPYTAKEGDCGSPENSPAGRIQGYERVNRDETSLLNAVANQVVSVMIDASGLQLYSGGIYTNPFCGLVLNHAVAAVGYGETDYGMKYWIVKNSWGTDWGESGYIRMWRDSVGYGTCGIASNAYYPVKVEPTSKLPKDVL